MASIYADKNGYLFLKHSVNGKPKVESLKMKDTKDNRKKAEFIKKQKEIEIKLNNHAQPLKDITIEQAYIGFIKHKDFAVKTVKVYRNLFDKIYTILNKNSFLSEVNNNFVLNFKNSMSGLSENSKALYLRHLKVFVNYLLKNKFITHEVNIEIPKLETKQISVIPEEHQDLILSYLSKDNVEMFEKIIDNNISYGMYKTEDKLRQYEFIKFLVLTGFRKTEALALRWENIDFDNKVIIVRNFKGKRTELFPMHEELEHLLVKMNKDRGDKLFLHSSDGTKFWYRMLNTLKLPKYGLHMIRKSFATKLVKNNVSVFDAMKLLRHQDVKTTIKYYAKADMQKLSDELNKIF